MQQELVIKIWRRITNYSCLLLICLCGCSTVHDIKIGESAKWSYGYPSAFFHGVGACTNSSDASKVCDAADNMTEQVVSKNYSTDIKLRLKIGMSEEKIKSLLGSPDEVGFEDNKQILFYFSKHLKLILENGKLNDVIAFDNTKEEFLPVGNVRKLSLYPFDRPKYQNLKN